MLRKRAGMVKGVCREWWEDKGPGSAVPYSSLRAGKFVSGGTPPRAVRPIQGQSVNYQAKVS